MSETANQALLAKYGLTLRRLAVLAVLNRYGPVPDVEDRVAEGLAALVDAAHTFKPRDGRDGTVAFVRWALAKVAGQTRHGASSAQAVARREVSEVDLAPVSSDGDPITLEHLGEMGVTCLHEPARLGNEAIWAVRGGKTFTTTRLIRELVTEHKEQVARLLGVEPDELNATDILRILDSVADEELYEPAWVLEPPSGEDLVTRPLADVTTRRTLPSGEVVTEVTKGAQFTSLVNKASRGQTMWVEDQFYQPSEDAESWPSWSAGEASRQRDGDPAQDNLSPEEVIPEHLWRRLVGVWQNRVRTQLVQGALGRDSEASYLDPAAQAVVDVMRELRQHLDRLAVDIPCQRRALMALAEHIISAGRGAWWKLDSGIEPTVAMYAVLLRCVGLDFGSGWDPPGMPSAATLRKATESWLSKVYAASWHSDAVAIQTLVEGGSPQEARTAYRNGLQEKRGQRGL